MSFTNDLLCKNGMVVHHNNGASKIGQSLLLNKCLFTVEIIDVIRTMLLLICYFIQSLIYNIFVIFDGLYTLEVPETTKIMNLNKKLYKK